MDRTKGVGRGFDTLRIVLSIAILCWHSVVTSYGLEAELPFWTDPFVGGLVASLLPIFFALSGFLVMGSAVRTMSLKVFLAARLLRIVPALATEIAVSAVILGPLVTTLPVREYFTDIGFFRYFGSLVGKIQISLPGVFTTNPFEGVVNASLWTIAPEILCYTYIASVIATGLIGKPGRFSVVVVSAALVAALCDGFGAGVRELGEAFRPHTLIVAFALGNLLFVWRHSVPFNPGLFAVCLVVGLALVGQPRSATLATPFLVYVTVYLGLLPLPKIPLLDKGDYSYGIYLYAMPVQQTFVFAFPELRQWYWNILFALPVTVALAVFSWTFVEEPALRLRKKLTGRAADRASKRVSTASPAVIAVIFLYGVWLTTTQYTIPVLTQYNRWLFAAVALFSLGAVVLNRTGARAHGS